MYSPKQFIVLLTGALLLAPAQGARCVGNTYDLFVPSLTGEPLQCSGQLLGWGLQDGPGVSPCLAPVSATCATVADQLDGGNCTINLYNGGGTCDPAFRVGVLSCATLGVAYTAFFDHFDVQCI